MKEEERIDRAGHYGYDNGEIDIYDLSLKIWKWKYLIIAITLISTLVTFFYVRMTGTNTDIYTTTTSLRIGKIAGIMIEPPDDMILYLKSNEFQGEGTCLSSLNYEFAGLMLNISYSSSSPNTPSSCMQKATDKIIKRHDIIFRKALKRIKANLDSLKTKMVISPKFILDTYTFPTSMISKPETQNTKTQLRLKRKLAVAFLASLLFGIFLSFCIEYISAEIDKRKKKLD